MESIFVTLEVFQLVAPSILARLEALLNIKLIFVTLEVTQLAAPLISVRLEASRNI